MGQAESICVVMNERFKLLLELVNPLHRVELRETRVLLWVLDVGKCIECKEF
jgi:hypothetical protein